MNIQCTRCSSDNYQKAGTFERGQRYKCKECGKYFYNENTKISNTDLLSQKEHSEKNGSNKILIEFFLYPYEESKDYYFDGSLTDENIYGNLVDYLEEIHRKEEGDEYLGVIDGVDELFFYLDDSKIWNIRFDVGWNKIAVKNNDVIELAEFFKRIKNPPKFKSIDIEFNYECSVDGFLGLFSKTANNMNEIYDLINYEYKYAKNKKYLLWVYINQNPIATMHPEDGYAYVDNELGILDYELEIIDGIDFSIDSKYKTIFDDYTENIRAYMQYVTAYWD